MLDTNVRIKLAAGKSENREVIVPHLRFKGSSSSLSRGGQGARLSWSKQSSSSVRVEAGKTGQRSQRDLGGRKEQYLDTI